MHLKRIEIVGFKSFANKTVVEFEKGITAIVGPNGCGKSNISDAIRWVFGEKSAKMLRGSKMEDLIFSGTSNRKPLGYAEVSLVIDNEDRTLPIEYSEVVITRKLYRDGESEYMINKSPCRLKDINELIMGTGMGSNAYSMVEQGEIDYIVQAKSDERRFLIEEAAGISKYKNKKDEALRKLERTENNILRVNDIISEVEKNIRYAQRQAKKAERFKKYFDELKKLELVKAKLDKAEIEANKKRIEEVSSALKLEEKELEEKIESFKPRIEKLMAEIAESEKSLENLEAKRYELKSKISSIREKAAFNSEIADNLGKRNESLVNAIETAEKNKREAYSLLNEKKRELEDFYLLLERETARLRELNEEKEAVYEKLNKEKREFEDLEKRYEDALSSYNGLNEKRHAIERLIAVAKNKVEKNNEQLDRLAKEEEETLQKIVSGREEIERIIREYNELEAAISEVSSRKNSVKNDYLMLSAKLDDKKGKLREVESKIAALDEISSNTNSFKPGTEALLKRKGESEYPFGDVKSVLDIISPKEGYEHAVQAVIYEILYSVIAPSFRDAFSMLDYLEQNNLKNSVDIYVNSPLGGGDFDFSAGDNVLGLMSDYVSFKENCDYGLEEIFASVMVVKDIKGLSDEEIADILKSKHIVSLNGDVLTRERLLKRRSESDFLSGALVREERRRKLLKDKNLILAEIEILSEEVAGKENELRNIEDEEGRLSALLVERKIAIDTNEKISENVKETLSKIEEAKARLSSEKRALETEIVDLSNKLADIEKRLGDLTVVIEENKNFLDAKKRAISEINLEREDIEKRLTSAQTNISGLKEKEEYLKNTISMIEENAAKEDGNILKYREEIKENDIKISELTEESERERITLGGYENELAGLDEVINELKAKRDELTAVRDREMESINAMSKEYDNKKDAIHSYEMEYKDLEYREKSIEERIRQAYKIDMAEYDFSDINFEDVNYETLYADIESYSKRVDSLGTVNMLAIEEFNELQERYQFLIDQKSDLENARDSLMEAIKKINRTTKKLFVDVFNEVQANFQYYYRILFGGGEAELVLLDELNPLESGIDIIARPPGKKLQNIGLLSGGEKALTAVALLFALFKVKPSPFCLLDEVDAPLDEANIDRFLAVVREFSGTTQFIIITHNRKTIAMADSLFGVTMEEPGVSRIVSVRVKDINMEGGEIKDIKVSEDNRVLEEV